MWWTLKKKKKKSQFRGQCLCARARARARLLFRFPRPVLTSFSSSPSPFIGWGNAAVVADLCHFMARERFHTWCITSLLYVEAVICVQSGPLARVYKSIKHKLRTESPRIVWLAVLLTRYNADVVVVVVVAAVVVVVVVAQFYFCLFHWRRLLSDSRCRSWVRFKASVSRDPKSCSRKDTGL